MPLLRTFRSLLSEEKPKSLAWPMKPKHVAPSHLQPPIWLPLFFAVVHGSHTGHRVGPSNMPSLFLLQGLWSYCTLCWNPSPSLNSCLCSSDLSKRAYSARTQKNSNPLCHSWSVAPYPCLSHFSGTYLPSVSPTLRGAGGSLLPGL